MCGLLLNGIFFFFFFFGGGGGGGVMCTKNAKIRNFYHLKVETYLSVQF